ncbi:hypothetical protein GCM10027063_24390 [Promicromonospora xylanilytica]
MTYTFARDRSEYDAFLSRMRQIVDPGKRLPAWPFLSNLGQIDVCEYNEFSDDDFTEALEALARGARRREHLAGRRGPRPGGVSDPRPRTFPRFLRSDGRHRELVLGGGVLRAAG